MATNLVSECTVVILTTAVRFDVNKNQPPLESMAKSKAKRLQSKVRSRKLVIDSKEQWEALSSPTRAAIIECLSAIGPSSIKEIAASLGCSAELVHHHMPMLLETGFVVEEEPRQLVRHVERVFSEGGAEWVPDVTSDPDAASVGLTKTAKAWSRANERLVAEALADKDGDELAALLKVLTFRSETAFLSPAAEKQVRKHLDAIKEIFKEERTSPNGKHRSIYWALVPIEEK